MHPEPGLRRSAGVGWSTASPSLVTVRSAARRAPPVSLLIVGLISVDPASLVLRAACPLKPSVFLSCNFTESDELPKTGGAHISICLLDYMSLGEAKSQTKSRN